MPKKGLMAIPGTISACGSDGLGAMQMPPVSGKSTKTKATVSRFCRVGAKLIRQRAAGRGGDLAQSRTRQTSGLEKPQLASRSHLLLLLQNHPSKLPNLIHVWLDCGACGAAVAVTKRKCEREKARVVV